MPNLEKEGILLVDKPKGNTSFSLVGKLRYLSGIKKIGHAGTLDPFATGVLVLLVGRPYTKLSDTFLHSDKAYTGQIQLGAATDTYDLEGEVTCTSNKIPSLEEVEKAVATFQGEIQQIPPMYSAKKIQGKKLYELARKGIEIKRSPVKIEVQLSLLSYAYPHLTFSLECSKGTYVRSIAHDLGNLLGSCAHLQTLKRTRSGIFHIDDCVAGEKLFTPNFDYRQHLKSHI